jgi:O-antigen ligase
MVTSLKELIVVLAISALIFRLARPFALRYSEPRDYSRRRNIWYVLSAVAFLSPNIWLFALPAIPIFIWAGRKDRSVVALYLLMLHLVPPVDVDIPFPGINSLFALDNYRLLSLCVLLPAALRLRKSKDPQRIRGTTLIDMLLVAYGVIQVLLFVPPNIPNHELVRDSLTNEMRNAFMYFIDVLIPYYVISRSCATRAAISEAMAGFCLACVIMAAIGIFESLRHWLLYTDIAVRWTGEVYQGFFRYRAGSLRAQVSSGNPLALSFMLAVACGFWIYLGSHEPSKLRRYGVMCVLWLGLLLTYSRGPWIGAFAIYVMVLALGKQAFSRLMKGAFAGAASLLLVAQLPIGKRIINLLPFMKGTGDEETNFSITYRQRLAARSWELIQEHPFFGDQLALQKLDDLRQGEGIIDTVNTYAEITMFYGFIGMFVFIMAIFVPMVGAVQVVRKTLRTDPDFALLGSVIVACIVGTLVMMVTCSYILAYPKIFYALAALAAAYAYLGRLPVAVLASTSPLARSPEPR